MLIQRLKQKQKGGLRGRDGRGASEGERERGGLDDDAMRKEGNTGGQNSLTGKIESGRGGIKDNVSQYLLASLISHEFGRSEQHTHLSTLSEVLLLFVGQESGPL